MRKTLLFAVAAILVCGSAMAETVTFDFTLDNPWDWNSLPQNSSGYIDDSAKPANFVESPITMTLDGKFRRYAQQALGGITCLLCYKETSIAFAAADGYKMTEICFYGGKGKFADITVKEGEAELGAAQLTGGDGWNHTSSGAHIDEVYRLAQCNTQGPIVFYNPTSTTNVITKIEVSYEASALRDAGLSWSAKELTAFINGNNDYPTLSRATDAAVNFSSSNKEVATIDATGTVTLVSAGTTVITAACEANATYDWGEASYTLVVKPEGYLSVVYDFTTYTGADNKPVSAEFPEITNDWWTTNPDENKDIYSAGNHFEPLTISKEPTHITFTANGGHGNVRMAKSSGQINLQLGAGSVMTITLDDKYSFCEVELLGNTKADNNRLSTITTPAESGTANYNEDTKVLTWLPAERTIACVFDVSAGAYIETITVGYVKKTVQSGVEAIAVDADAPAVYYNLQGIRVDNPGTGLYIRRQGNRTEKVKL